MIRYLALSAYFMASTFCYSQFDVDNEHANLNDTLETIAGTHEFFGLATYYNEIQFLEVRSHSFSDIQQGVEYKFNQGTSLVALGRFKALVGTFEDDASIIVYDNQIDLSLNEKVSPFLKPVVIQKSGLKAIYPQLDQLRYRNLWRPFALLAKCVEWLIVNIQKTLNLNWGLAIMILAIILKLLLLPLSVLTVKLQRQTSQVQAKLAPELREIKSKFKGEEAHNRIMEAHKKQGVSPFYVLKPMAATLIQIPILIAVFNALGETSQFDSATFLWIDDLSAPDEIARLPFNIPFFGHTISLLPFIMTIITASAAMAYSNRHASREELAKQRRNLLMMGGAFFLLFYPFPSSMVLYWSVSNLLHIFQQRVIKI